MMRLFANCLSLPLLLAATFLAGQQPQSGSANNPARNTSAKQPSAAAAKKTTAHHAGKKHSKASSRNGKKRAAYRPEYTENSVQVINGDATKKVVFQDDQPASAKSEPKQAKNAPPPPIKVEVMNGSSTDTQYFSGNQDEQMAEVRNRPVVIGVQSSNTRRVGGEKHPVVTSVNSAEGEDAKASTGAGQPVMNSVAPHPKRPEYQPDMH